MDNLLKFYEQELSADGFYQLLNSKLAGAPNQYNSSNLLLGKINSENNSTESEEMPLVEKGDVRFDMPILIGNKKAKERILILGLEPRHTDDFYNIMKVKNRVYATPFGIDRWYSKSKQSIYASAFKDFLSNDRLFLFSDFVKEYNVIDPNLKNQNDQQARQNFQELFEMKYKNILEQEIQLFKPTRIIGLGKTDIRKKIPSHLLSEYAINVISHPTNGNFNKMINEMNSLFN